MTAVVLATRDATPQVHGPFHVTFATLNATADGDPLNLFTPNGATSRLPCG